MIVVKCINLTPFCGPYFTIGKLYPIVEYRGQTIGIINNSSITYIIHLKLARQMFDLSKVDKLMAFI